MTTYREAIRAAEKRLEKSNASLSSVKLLMYELTREQDIDLYLHYEDEANTDILVRFDMGIDRLVLDEPLAYILGYQWFYGRKFLVGKDVFIPRYETEELCGNVLAVIDECFADKKTVDVADIATGSGAIAVTIRCEETKARCYATDISDIALNAAKRNADLNKAPVTFLQGSMLQPLIERGIKLDVLISNPPYIGTHEELDRSVKDFEPHLALFGGDDGLVFYREILKNAHLVLREKAVVAFEIGYQQKTALMEMASLYWPNERCEVLRDLSGKDRMMFLYVNL